MSTTFGDTYGPVAGMVALLLWASLSSVAAAPLEGVRSGAARSQDAEKVAESEPDGHPPPKRVAASVR